MTRRKRRFPTERRLCQPVPATSSTWPQPRGRDALQSALLSYASTFDTVSQRRHILRVCLCCADCCAIIRCWALVSARCSSLFVHEISIASGPVSLVCLLRFWQREAITLPIQTDRLTLHLLQPHPTYFTLPSPEQLYSSDRSPRRPSVPSCAAPATRGASARHTLLPWLGLGHP